MAASPAQLVAIYALKTEDVLMYAEYQIDTAKMNEALQKEARSNSSAQN